MIPTYVDLISRDGLRPRIEAAYALLSPCRLCPRECRANRLGDETGYCRTGQAAQIANWGPHFGEERPISGRSGSGTIFFTHCNLGCEYCQNWNISHGGDGIVTDAARLAGIMLDLQQQGCHNINLVTPTHVLPQILEALAFAADGGLQVPLVWNCGGYESVEALRLLDGLVDIYMPDAKYAAANVGQSLSAVPDYPQRNQAALAEMYRQVGDLALDSSGIATRGLLVRHLVLPENLAGTAEVARFLASLSKQTYVNIMNQYHPCYRADRIAGLGRRITRGEYEAAVQAAKNAGLCRFDKNI